MRQHSAVTSSNPWETSQSGAGSSDSSSCSLLMGHISSVQFSCSVVSDSLQPHESQHIRPPCPSPTPEVYPNSCPFSQWCHPTISSSVVPLLLPPSLFPSIRVFSNESHTDLLFLHYQNRGFLNMGISFRRTRFRIRDVQPTLEHRKTNEGTKKWAGLSEESLYKLLALLSFLISHFKKEHESGLSKIKLVKYLFNKRQKWKLIILAKTV